MIPPAYEQNANSLAASDLDPKASKVQNILVATTDSGIRRSLTELLQNYSVKMLWAAGMEEVKSALHSQDIAACFCGFWLVDGTYRDVVRQFKRHSAEIPVIVVSEPASALDYQNYFGALNISSFGFMSHPYQNADLERVLQSKIGLRNPPAALPAPAARTSDVPFLPSALSRAS